MRTQKALFLAAAALLAGACGGGTEEPIEAPTPFPGASPFVYPAALVDLDARGETVLMVHVTTAGMVDSAYVLTGATWSEFDSAAVTGARKLRFSPGRQGDRRVAMWARLPVRFAPDTVVTLGLTAPDSREGR